MTFTDGLSESEAAFLQAIQQGESARHYAERLHYSHKWAEWLSQKIRRKLGVATLREALELSEGATITRADLEAITKAQEELRKAVSELRDASTGSERTEAKRDVNEARSDLADELRLRGLSMKDLDRIQSIKEEERFLALYEKKRAEEEAAKPKRKRRAKPKDEPVTDGKKKGSGNPFADLFRSKSDDGDEGDEDGDEDDD